MDTLWTSPFARVPISWFHAADPAQRISAGEVQAQRGGQRSAVERSAQGRGLQVSPATLG